MKLKKPLLALPLLILISLSSIAWIFPKHDPKPLPSVVKIGCARGHGTGFFVGDNLIMSAAHVWDACKDIGLNIQDVDDAPIRLELVKVSGHTDLVLVHSPRAGEPLKLHNGPIEIASTLTVLGFPGPENVFLVTRGIVSGFLGDEMILTDAMCYFGNSGGPGVDADGRLLGVLVGLNSDSHLCYLVSLQQVRVFLE